VVAFFQTTAEEILGNGWQDVIHPDDLAACVARWTHSLSTGEPYEIEFRLRRGDGVYRWHLGRANAERDANGSILRWFGTNTDIHDAKLAIAELQARSEYEQRLIGIVSHDLRNPLNSISMGASLLSTRALGDVEQKIVTRISRAADRSSRLITDLLDFATARIGTSIPINPRPTNLREIVEHVVDEFHAVASSHLIRIGHSGPETGNWTQIGSRK
jgi:signal transduction histidine kinase